MFSNSTRAAYWSYHVSRSAFFVVQGLSGGFERSVARPKRCSLHDVVYGLIKLNNMRIPDSRLPDA